MKNEDLNPFWGMTIEEIDEYIETIGIKLNKEKEELTAKGEELKNIQITIPEEINIVLGQALYKRVNNLELTDAESNAIEIMQEYFKPHKKYNQALGDLSDKYNRLRELVAMGLEVKKEIVEKGLDMSQNPIPREGKNFIQ
jgi:cell division protein ZapA (FtsZ GTPase activity inhibitor)